MESSSRTKRLKPDKVEYPSEWIHGMEIHHVILCVINQYLLQEDEHPMRCIVDNLNFSLVSKAFYKASSDEDRGQGIPCWLGANFDAGDGYPGDECCICKYSKLSNYKYRDSSQIKRWICLDCAKEWVTRQQNRECHKRNDHADTVYPCTCELKVHVTCVTIDDTD